MNEAINLATSKLMEKNPEIQWYKPPSVFSFKRRLLKDFTEEEIKQFRTVKIKGG